MMFCDYCNCNRDSPFCPACGDRLTTNKHIGLSMTQLTNMKEHAARELRQQLDAIKRVGRRHVEEMDPEENKRRELSDQLNELNEALEWAKKHDIQHPDYRR